ncbi:hypothetical protein MMC30_009111 [Trapelia coarctata]|nr:hypothetical protein [Trapelia coarctata]
MEHQVNAVNLIGPTDSRVLQIFYGTTDLENIFQTGGDDEDSAVNGVSKGGTQIELKMYNILDPNPKAGWDSSYNQWNTASLTGTDKDDNEDVNRIFEASGSIGLEDPITGKTDIKGEKLSSKRRKKPRIAVKTAGLSAKRIAGDSILTNDDEGDGCNSDENNDRDSSRDGYQKS